MGKKSILSAVCLYVTGTAMTAGAADIAWVTKDFDFGSIIEAEGKKRGFSQFVNVGADTIAIKDARTQCTCTYVDYPTEDIAPGDTATIRFTFNPEGMSGNVDRIIRLVLSDGTKPIIRLKGKVK